VSLESDVYGVLGPLASGAAYPNVAPSNAPLPRIVYQKVGGVSVETLEVGRVGHRNTRIQVAVWATTSVAAAALARSVEDALMASETLKAVSLGASLADYEPDTNLYGERQDFSIWF
jgi:hypothetical protein